MQATTRYSAVINSGCLLWMPPMAEQEYRDAMASLLYAQLAARKQHSPVNDPGKWQEVFGSALTRFGWAPLRTGYRSRGADEHFRLAELIEAADLPLTEPQRQAGGQLCTYLAALPGADPQLQLLQRNIAGYADLDAVDGVDGDTSDGHGLDLMDDFEALSCPAPTQGRARQVQALRRPAPRAVVTAHFGMLLPQRRIELLSVHFATQQRLAANIFEQSFSGAKVLDGILLRSFVGELSEMSYAPFRAQFDTLLKPYWQQQVVEHLPFSRATP